MDCDISSFREIYPFPSHFFSLNGHRMHYLDQGQGEVILMLHGNPTWSFFYRNFIPELSAGYRVVVPDHLGCGLSDKPGDYEYILENHIANLEQLVEYLSLRDVTLVMHDWGGVIGMGYATRHPQNIKRLVVLNTAAFTTPSDYRLPWRIRVCRTPVFGKIGVRFFNLFTRLAIPVAVKHRDKITPQIKTGYLAPYNSYRNRIAIHEFVRDIPLSPKHRSYRTLQQIEQELQLFRHTPTLINWAGKDFVLNDIILQKWLELFPHAQLENYPDAGHYLQEDAYERIIPRIKQFLKETGD